MTGLEEDRRGSTSADGIEHLAVSVPSRPAGDLNDDQLLAKSRNSTRWELTVTAASWVAPRMLRLAVSAPGLTEMNYQPGHDFTVLVAHAAGRAIRRRYTIAGRGGADMVHLDVFVHGDGIGTAWAQTRRVGDCFTAIGPRGSFVLGPPADRHVFVGDETSIPGINAMLANTDRPADVVVEVDDPCEWEPLAARGRPETTWIWLPRSTATTPLHELVLPATENSHAYVSGEASRVLAWREELERRGMDASVITHKAYWGAGRANATHGEPLA